MNAPTTESAAASLSVAAFGMPDSERQVLERIFGLSSSRATAYRLAAPGAETGADIMLVDRDNPDAVANWRRAVQGAAPRRPGTVLVASAQPGDCRFHVRRPFMATRVLGTLDELVAQTARPAPGSAPATSAAPARTPAPDPRPAARAKPTPRAPTPGETPATIGSPGRYRALVVDDSMAVRKQISLVLERLKVNADFADAGEKALALLDERAYDIVLLDVVMPGVDGYDVCKSIKRDRARKHIPVVMLTGRSSPFDKVKGKLSGCNAYLTKPVSGRDFVQTLKKYLRDPIAFE